MPKRVVERHWLKGIKRRAGVRDSSFIVLSLAY